MAAADIVIDDPRNDSDFEQFTDVDAVAFGHPRESSRRWLDPARRYTRFRFARVGDTVIGGYCLMPAAQFWGGRSVPAQCVSAVAVHPMWRGQGVAGRLMRDLVELCAGDHVATAPLLAATVTLYRRWGWEIAERAFNHWVLTEPLARLRGEGEVVEVTAKEVEAFRRQHFVRWDGPLDRPDWWLTLEWGEEPNEHRFLWGWREGDGLTGYMRYAYKDSSDSEELRVEVDEFVAVTPDALRGMLSLLGRSSSLTPRVRFHHCFGARHPLLYVLPDASKSVESSGGLCLMQRIVDVPAALQARGWNTSFGGAVELAVEDPVTGEQCVAVEWNDGQAHATPGGSGRVRTSTGTLSAWFCGTLRMTDAALMGIAHGAAADLEAMDAAVAGRPVWMPDHF